MIFNILNLILSLVAVVSIPLMMLGFFLGVVFFIISMTSEDKKKKKMFIQIGLGSVLVPIIILMGSLILWALLTALKAMFI